MCCSPKAVSRDLSTSSRRIVRCLVALGWLLVGVFALRTALLGQIGVDVRAFQVAYITGSLGYLALVWVVTHWGNAGTLGSWRWWLVGCIAIRALLLGTSPSDDTYRYVWEGRVQVAGVNPYRHPPDDPKLLALRDEDWSKINHPDYPAIYGPVVQLEFLAAAALAPSRWTLKAAHLVWDVLIVVILGASLRRAGHTPHRAIVYALCPLVLASFGVEGHVDSLMLLFVTLAVWAAVSGRTNVVGAMVGLAIATKIVSLVLLPWLVLRRRSGPNDVGPALDASTGIWPALKPAAVAIGVAAICYLPYSAGGVAPFSSLLRFGTADEFFSMLGAFGVTSFENVSTHWLIALALGAVLIVLARRASEFVAYGAAAMGALLMLTPIVHYWYVSWVLVLLPFGLRVRWIVAAVAMVIYFEAELHRRTTGSWSMPPWAPLAVWVPFAVAWGVETLICWRARCARREAARR